MRHALAADAGGQPLAAVQRGRLTYQWDAHCCVLPAPAPAGKGKSFGELALLYDAPRAATVVATSEEVRAWAVDRVTFKQVMIGTTIRKRETYEAFLRGVPIFSTLTGACSRPAGRAVGSDRCSRCVCGNRSDGDTRPAAAAAGVVVGAAACAAGEEILTIADALVPVSFKAGEVVVQQGDLQADR